MDKQLDVLFIEPNSSKKVYQDLGKDYAAIETPTWALLLAESCRSIGYGVGILDANAERLSAEDAVKRIGEANPRIACFTVYGQNPNSGTTNMIGATETADLLKKTYPEMKIMFIGSHTSALPREVLGHNFVDYIAINEGVYTLHDLLQSNQNGDLKNVRGLGYKDDGRMLLNPGVVVPGDRMDIDMPGYAWDLLPYNQKPLDLYRAHFWHAEFNHDLRTPFAALYTSLGCQFKCRFCMINIVNRTSTEDEVTAENSNGMRFWSPELMLKEYDKLVEMGVETIRLSDEMFFFNARYYEPLLNGLIERGYGDKLRMWAYARVDTVREKYLDLFRAAGIKWLALGVEAANQDVRLEVTKGSFKDVNIRDVVAKTRAHDVNVIANYIFGFPPDTMESMQQTLDLSKELNAEMWNAYPCMALPGSPLYMESLKRGWEVPKDYAEFSFLSYECKPMRTNTLTAAEVLKFRDDAFQEFFNYQPYLDMVKRRFGQQAHDNVVEMAKIKLKRKLLGD